MPQRYTLDTEEDKVNVLYYGEQGTTKTTCCASLAKLGKVMFVDAEAGLKRRPLIDLGVPVQNIEVFRAITTEELDNLFWELRDSDEYIGLVWDSLSEGHQKLLLQTSEASAEEARAKGKVKSKYDVWLDDYGINTQEVRQLCRQFRDLSMHTAFTALPRRDQDDDGTVKYGPDLTPKLSEAILGYVDIVCHTYAIPIIGQDEPQYWGQFRAVGKWRAKDRFHSIPPKLAYPTMDRIIAYVNGGLTTEDDDIQQTAVAELVKAEIRESEEAATPPKAAPKLATKRIRGEA